MERGFFERSRFRSGDVSRSRPNVRRKIQTDAPWFNLRRSLLTSEMQLLLQLRASVMNRTAGTLDACTPPCAHTSRHQKHGHTDVGEYCSGLVVCVYSVQCQRCLRVESPRQNTRIPYLIKAIPRSRTHTYTGSLVIIDD